VWLDTGSPALTWRPAKASSTLSGTSWSPEDQHIDSLIQSYQKTLVSISILQKNGLKGRFSITPKHFLKSCQSKTGFPDCDLFNCQSLRSFP
jgi:hypothetical protein